MRSNGNQVTDTRDKTPIVLYIYHNFICRGNEGHMTADPRIDGPTRSGHCAYCSPRDRRRIMTPPEVITTFIDDHTDEAIDLLETLLAHDTQNPPGETAELLAWIETYLDSLGLATDRVVVDPAKPNLIATLPGERDGTLLFTGHIDTVPFDRSAWEQDPLGERDGDRIYGRGATDMKGPLAAMLMTARVFAETETRPPLTLRFVIVSDEEIAGDAGLPAVLAADAIEGDYCLIGETTCEQEYHSVTVADKGSIWLTLEAVGSAAHGSRPMLGTNAIDRLYTAIQRIRREFGSEPFAIAPELEPIIDESIEYYSLMMDGSTARTLFTHPTINLGTLTGGESINSVPQTAESRLDIRLTPGVETPTMLNRIRECAEECEGITIADVSWSVGTYERLDSPLVEAVSEAAEMTTGDRIYRRSATGGGDAKKLRNEGIPTVEFGLGTDTAHAVDEFTTISALSGNVHIYSQLPYRLAKRG